jgi:iron complex outermembrane receptor protein
MREASPPLTAVIVVACTLGFSTIDAFAQSEPASQTLSSLKQLSIDELANLEVTSVSRRPEALSRAASAIQVITQNDIRRSGATRLPEALRLASNLEVDQIDSSEWAISARGFNSGLANKLLVLIDGRTVYSPLFAGVFWDAQDVLLEDIDRIEVISGPGAALWGANAVNGVINITTKSAQDTPGLFLEGLAGDELQGAVNARYGGALTPNLRFRVYGKYSKRNSGTLSSGEGADDNWQMGQGGFRLDWTKSSADLLTLQGDLYEDRLLHRGPDPPASAGANVIGRWSHTISKDSDVKVQFYFDRTHRNIPGSYDDALDTYDLDFQHRRLSSSGRHDVVWGASYRGFNDDFGPGSLVFVPRRVLKQTAGAFVQDEIALLKDRVSLTLGTKVDHDPYTGIELQPSLRLAWTSTDKHTLWGAISRAVRTPSRLDRDYILPPYYAGGPDFASEELVAYEAGYRVQPRERLSLSIASYYNDYDRIRTIELGNPPAPYPVFIGNGQLGESYGAELTADYQATEWWRIRSGYSELRVHIRPAPGTTDLSFGQTESGSSNRHVSFRSSLDITKRVQFDPAFRYVSRITNPRSLVPGYCELDLNLAWQPTNRLSLSVVGQSLLHDHHVEYGNVGSQQEIARGLDAKITIRW